MQVFKQFHKILLDIFNHMLPTIYTVRSLEPVLNCTEGEGWGRQKEGGRGRDGDGRRREEGGERAEEGEGEGRSEREE